MIQNMSTWEFLFIFCAWKILDFQSAQSDLLLAHEHFLQLCLIIACVLVMLISFSGVSIIFRFDDFSLCLSLFIFFYLFPKFWENVCFLSYQFNFLASILLFSVPRKDIWFCHCISISLTLFKIFLFISTTFLLFSYSCLYFCYHFP